MLLKLTLLFPLILNECFIHSDIPGGACCQKNVDLGYWQNAESGRNSGSNLFTFLNVPNRLTRGPEMDGMTWETELAMKKQR